MKKEWNERNQAEFSIAMDEFSELFISNEMETLLCNVVEETIFQ